MKLLKTVSTLAFFAAIFATSGDFSALVTLPHIH